MNKNSYIVSFVNGKSLYIRAFNKDEARILSQAWMINNAMTYEVLEIIETTKHCFECDVYKVIA